MVTIKICGITQPDQALAIAAMGVSYLGFILVPSSPRFVPPESLPALTTNLPPVGTVGVFLNHSLSEITHLCALGHFTAIQLHGQESPQFCQTVKQTHPDRLLIKALSLKQSSDLEKIANYSDVVDIVLLDAYDPHQAGGTGKTLPWHLLKNLAPECSWWLAGGLRPENLTTALATCEPKGIDLSSGVEDKPGWKNLAKVAAVVTTVQRYF